MSANASVGFVIGMVAFWAGVLAATIMPLTQVHHDPEMLLKLRTECLEHDPSLCTTYCDNYAEKYSRIEPRK